MSISPLFVLRSPRPRKENTSRGAAGREPESRGALRTSSSQPAAAKAGTLSCPEKRSERAERLLTAALSHPVTCEEVLRLFARWCSGAPNAESQDAYEPWQKNTWRRRPLLSHQQLGLDITHNICHDLSKQTMLEIDVKGRASLSL